MSSTDNLFRQQKGLKVKHETDYIGSYLKLAETIEWIREYFINEPVVYKQKGLTWEEIKNDKILNDLRINN